MTRKFSLADANVIEATPGAKLLTDNHIVAPRTMWNLRSKHAREVIALAESHPTVGVAWRWYQPTHTLRPSRLLSAAREMDALDYAVAEMVGEPETPGGSYGFVQSFYRFNSSNGQVYLNAEWSNVFIAQGYHPAVAHWRKAVQWQDEKGRRVGYQMPAIPPEKLKEARV